MELMQSTSPSSYSTVLQLDKKIRDLSAAINIYEDEQFNATAATLEWNCILGANVRQAGKSLFPLRFRALAFGYPDLQHIFCVVAIPFFFPAISIAMPC